MNSKQRAEPLLRQSIPQQIKAAYTPWMPEFCEFIESEISVSLNGVRPLVQDKIKTSTNMSMRRLLKFGAYVFLLLPMEHVVCLLSNAAAFIDH